MLVQFFIPAWIVWPSDMLTACVSALTRIVQTLIGVAFFIAFAYYVGWIHRIIIFCAERELSKILNGTPVTIGYIRIDLLRGRYWASNILLHSPRRNVWKWNSPVVARIGHVYAECNVVFTLLSLWFLREERPIDVATVEASDIQGFVERRDKVFNFFLMDPSISIPDPVMMEEEEDNHHHDEAAAAAADGEGSGSDNNNACADVMQESSSQVVDDEQETRATDEDGHRDSNPKHDRNGNSNNHSNRSSKSAIPSSEVEGGDSQESRVDPNTTSTVTVTTAAAASSSAQAAAHKLVDDMMRVLGKAATQPDRNSFQSALVESRQRIKTELKNLQKVAKKTDVMQEGVKIVQHVSKSLVEKSQTVPSVVFPPKRRKHSSSNSSNGHYKKSKVVYGRLGRIILREVRVFTRDHRFDITKDEDKDDDHGNGNGNDHDYGMQEEQVCEGWNKPIYLHEVMLRSAELCPPMSANDANGLPMIYQPIDRCIEIIWKRVLTKIAETNTGALFRTAISEVLGFYMDSSNSNKESSQSIHSMAD